VTLTVAGVDLSGRRVGKTALAWLDGDSHPSLKEPPVDAGLRGDNGDRRLVDLIVDREPAVVALDAPLELPHAVTCRDPSCSVCFPSDGGAPSYGSRTLEGEGWRALMPGVKGPMPMVMVAGIAFRGIYLRRRLERLGFRVAETWPMGVYRVLERAESATHFGSLDAAARLALLSRVVNGTELIDVEDDSRDQADAVAAAYAAWCVSTGNAEALQLDGSEDEGAIWLPALPPGVRT
jgi:predicted nuclease with RNAse H fold